MPFVIPLGVNTRRKIILKETEILLFKELLIHRVMQSRDIHEFINAVSEHPPTPNSITNRLTRLVQSGVLYRMEETLDPNRPSVKWYYYRLTKRGLMVLVDVGILPSKKVEEVYTIIRKSLIPKPHNLALSSIVNNIRVQSIKSEMECEHQRGGMWVEETDKDLPFVPDWVFRQKEKLLFLEVDSGTESLAMIDKKVERYIDYARTSTKEIIVIFSIVDNSVYRMSIADRSKRISSLKETMPPVHSWPTNLSIYVLSAERTASCFLRLFKGVEPLESEYRGYVLDEWVGEWKEHTHCNYKLLEKEGVYGSNRVPHLEADVVVQFHDKEGIRLMALIYGEEGSVKTYQQIRSNHIRSTKVLPGAKRLDGVMIIYNDYELLTNDVHGIHTWDRAWFTFRGAWQHEGENGKYPEMLKPISPYRKEWFPFE